MSRVAGAVPGAEPSLAISLPGNRSVLVVIDVEVAALVAAILGRALRRSDAPAAYPALLALTEDLIRAASDGQERPTNAAPVDVDALMPDHLLMDTVEVAATLRIGERTARRRIESGEIPSVKLGGRRLVSRSALASWVTNLEVTGAASAPRLRETGGGRDVDTSRMAK